jgi:hypothetical protein
MLAFTTSFNKFTSRATSLGDLRTTRTVPHFSGDAILNSRAQGAVAMRRVLTALTIILMVARPALSLATQGRERAAALESYFRGTDTALQFEVSMATTRRFRSTTFSVRPINVRTRGAPRR